jgi:hypothetical protein
MRAALWHHLMRAASLVRKNPAPGLEVVDVDADTRTEVILSAGWGAAVVSPHDGILTELDDWSVGANLLAVVARHREAYHLADENPSGNDDREEGEMAASAPSSDVDRASLIFDDRPLGGLVDVIDGLPVTARCEWQLDGSGLTTTTEERSLAITKRFRATLEGLECEQTVTARGEFRGTFSSETAALPLNLGRDTTRNELVASTTGWTLVQPEGEVALNVSLEPMGKVTGEPIETASASLEGLQKMFQGTIVTTTWDLDLGPGESFEIRQVLRPRIHNENLGKKEPGVSA